MGKALLRIGSKGLSFNQMSSVAMVFVLVGITIGIGAHVNSEVAKTGGFTQAAYKVANTTLGNATSGLAKLSSWLPIIAVVLAASVVIGVLVVAFSSRGGV